MASQETLHFGVELELLVKERKKNQDWESLARDVSKTLARRAGISNHVSKGGKAQETYHEWAIMQEVTIPSQDGFVGVELVSPIYSVQSEWDVDLNRIFAALDQDRFTIRVSSKCSTHVHLSRVPTPLSTDELVALAHAVLHYERALDALVPEARRGGASHWCQSNRASHALAHLPSLMECHAVVDGALDAGPSGPRVVAEAVNLVAKDSRYGRARGMTRDFVRGKMYKWNFAGAVPGHGLGTVEFRQPPGSISARDAVVWVTLALAFVAGAVGGTGHFPYASGSADVAGASVDELWSFLISGAQALGWSDLGDVAILFAGEHQGEIR